MQNDENIFFEKGASSEIKKDKFELSLAGVEGWLKYRGILNESENLIKYQDLDDWYRSGSKTYFTSFKMDYVSKKGLHCEKSIGIKAITALPVESYLEHLSHNRKILIDNDIPVSNWHWYGNGVIIEDYYPNNAKSVVSIESLYEIAYKLDNIGYFSQSGILKDVRCDLNGTPYVTDLGFNLLDDKKNVALKEIIKFFPDKEKTLKEFYTSMSQSGFNKTVH